MKINKFNTFGLLAVGLCIAALAFGNIVSAVAFGFSACAFFFAGRK